MRSRASFSLGTSPPGPPSLHVFSTVVVLGNVVVVNTAQEGNVLGPVVSAHAERTAVVEFETGALGTPSALGV